MKRRPRRLSIKASLILLFVGFNAGLLLLLYLAGASWYAGDRRGQLDSFLRTEAGGVAATLTASLGEAGQDSSAAKAKLQDPAFSHFLTEFLARRQNSPSLYNTTLLITDPAGALIAVSNQALNIDPRFLLDNRARIYGRKLLEDGAELFSVAVGRLDYRVMQLPLRFRETTAGTIRLACLIEPAVASSSVLLLSAAFFFFSAILISAGGGIFLVTLILRPIRAMNAVMNSVTEQNLSSRLELLPGNDEVSALAAAFNRTLDRIETAYRSQEQLVSDLSHQLRTPLTSMRGTVELALYQERSAEDYQAILTDSLVGIDRITDLVNTMLSLAKLNGHIESLNYAPCGFPELIKETIGELAPLWEEKSIGFGFRYRFYRGHRIEEYREDGAATACPAEIAGLFVIEADAARFQQAIINLLDNAYKFTPPGGRIDVELYREVTGDARFCRLVIMNPGPPIPAAAIPRLFTPFFQGEGAPDGERADGFGLGLSICRRIIEMHQGKIRAFNPVGGGAAFEIILPVKQSDKATGIA